MDEHQRTAVMAHTLLGSVSVVVGAAQRLAEEWDDRDEAQLVLLRELSEHADQIKSVLSALVRGLPADASTR